MAVMEAGPLINPSYEPLGKLTRSVHCDDLLEGIDYTCNSFNLKPAVKVYSLLSPHIETTLQGVKVIPRQKLHAAHYEFVFFMAYVLSTFFLHWVAIKY